MSWDDVKTHLMEQIPATLENGDKIRFKAITPGQFEQSKQRNRYGKMVYTVTARILRGGRQFSSVVYLTPNMALQLVDLNAFDDDGGGYGVALFVRRNERSVDFDFGKG